jgi:hypothetical protein
MRNILRTVAGVVIFLTGYFYIFGKSNEGCAAEAKSPPIRQELNSSRCFCRLCDSAGARVNVAACGSWHIRN